MTRERMSEQELDATLADLGEHLAYPRPTRLADARVRAGFPVRVPSDARLGTPDEVYREGADAPSARQRISLVYGQRAGIPISHEPGVSVLVVEFRGTVDENLTGGKGVGPDTKIESLSVNGGRGLWLEGAPHLFFYRDASGIIQTETLRLAGNTLIWEQDGVTFRLEAQVSREDSLRIAASFR